MGKNQNGLDWDCCYFINEKNGRKKDLIVVRFILRRLVTEENKGLFNIPILFSAANHFIHGSTN